jgi:hypothetical protein
VQQIGEGFVEGLIEGVGCFLKCEAVANACVLGVSLVPLHKAALKKVGIRVIMKPGMSNWTSIPRVGAQVLHGTSASNILSKWANAIKGRGLAGAVIVVESGIAIACSAACIYGYLMR